MNQELRKYEASWLEYLTLVAIIFVSLWAWIFVEKDTLQRSEAAQTAVGFVTTLLPWIAALEKYGPAAHKLLLVHSVCNIVYFPLVFAIWLKLFNNRPKKSPLDGYSLFKLISAGVLPLFFFIATYYDLGSALARRSGRSSYSLVLSPLTMPLWASIQVIAIWLLVLTQVFFIILAINIARRSRG